MLWYLPQMEFSSTVQRSSLYFVTRRIIYYLLHQKLDAKICLYIYD